MNPPLNLDQLQSVFGPCVFLKWPLGVKGDKRKWKHLTLADMTPEYLAGLLDGNVGIALGQVSNGLCAIDLDDDDLVKPFMEANPWMAKTTVTRGARGCQVWVRIKGNYPPASALKRDGRKCGEWRTDGNQSIVPPSIHPDTGRPYTFVSMMPVMEIPYNDIHFPSLLQIGTDIAQISTETTQCFCIPEPSPSVPICNEKAFPESVSIDQYNDIVAPFIPVERGSNHRLLFGLARRLKLLQASGVKLEPTLAFEAWYDSSKTLTRQNKTVDEYRVEFFEALDCVQDDDLVKAWLESGKVKAPGAGVLSDPDNSRLAAMCYELARRSSDGVFYLSCRSVAYFFRIHHTDGARRLKLLTNKSIQILEIVNAGSPQSGKATRYRYIGNDGRIIH